MPKCALVTVPYSNSAKLFPRQIISQVLLADAVTSEVFIGILVVTPNVLANPAVTLDPLASRTALVEGQRNIIFPSLLMLLFLSSLGLQVSFSCILYGLSKVIRVIMP